MWGEPRKGTEAYAVKQMAEARKKEACEKGLDKLITDVYFEKLKGLTRRVTIGNGWEAYKYPKIDNLEETEGNKQDKYSKKITFHIEDRDYSLVQSDGHYMEHRDGRYYYLDLFLNAKKVFGLMVDEDSNEYVTTYSPSLITAYANDEWVTDFRLIQEHYNKASKQSEIAYAEDPQKTRELMENFGIQSTDLKQEAVSASAANKNMGAVKTIVTKKPFWKKWWFWAIVAYLILISLS
jgi:hypothetical protein